MIVEFLGIPGAGKTTLASTAIQFLRNRGLKVMSVIEAGHFYAKRTHMGRIICFLVRSSSLQRSVLWQVFYYSSVIHRVGFTIENTALLRYVVTSQLCRPISWQHRRLILRHFFLMVGYHQLIKRYKRTDEIVISDDWFSHRVTHLYASELEKPSPDRIVEYLKLVPKSGLIILVCAPLSTCVERVYARGLRGRLGGKSRQEVTQFLANAEQAVNTASCYLNNAGEKLIKIETNGDLDVCVADLCNNLEKSLFLY